MGTNKFKVIQAVAGLERKEIARVIAEASGTEYKYEGVPSCSYTAGGWIVERTGELKSPEFALTQSEAIKTVLLALQAEGVTATGNLTVFTSTNDDDTGMTAKKLFNIIGSKEKLLKAALGRETDIVPSGLLPHLNETQIETVAEFLDTYKVGLDEGKFERNSEITVTSDGLGLGFFNATLNFDEISAYITLADKLMTQARLLKYASPKEKEASNPKYAFRCFLLRLGFIGNEYKNERKILLSKLDGNSAFKTAPTTATSDDGSQNES